ncbi:DUF1444 family protein [Alkalicoccus chagannorensis]|uniref:DUF1444 family protein n=1 Tax=Alkalicoccus chagannorensis TaxID=427072 RepID=UPI00040A2D60|nr:DUF1444 family protein [Alkalicoccus chagannorensis]
MKPIEIKRELEKRLENDNWVTSFDKDQNTFRVVDKRVDQGITVRLANLTEKFETSPDEAAESTVSQIKEGMRLLVERASIKGNEDRIYPVLRTPDFGVGKQLLSTEHTAETAVFYAVDEGSSYTMIDERMIEEAGTTEEQIKETAAFNLRSLPVEWKKDETAGNIFYFLHTGDGYEASRLLDQQLLDRMADEVEGDFVAAVPHHDVLILADIRNESGYDVIAQMAFKFFSEGHIPLTALPLLYENGALEPLFILARKKPKDTKKDG